MGLRTACLSLTAVFLIVFVFISIISDDIQGSELKGEDEVQINPERSKERTKRTEKSNIKKRESGYMDEFGNDEIDVGGKRFKLFEKKHLNYKKATAYCKKNDGKLAEAMNLEEMRRLQLLLMKARSIGNDMWVGADKKEWKKHSLKMQRRPNFGPDPMLFGGGPTEMCPALSVSTRSLTPVSCSRDLPFICEFGPGISKSGNKATKTATRADSTSKGKSKPKSKVEMRRKREVSLNTATIADVKETTVSSNEEEDTTEMYITESPAEAAAEHNIGFSPHVEHVEMDGLTTSGKPGNISSTPADTSMKLVQDSTKATTTLDPDQMLIDLIDEQTVNLTAIELEAMNASANLASNVLPSQLPSSQVAVSRDPKASLKIVEFIDSNDIADNVATASLEPEYANNSALVLSEELQQGNASYSADSYSTDSHDSTESPSSTSDATFNLPYTSGTKPPTEETIEGNKRPMRNASFPQQVKVEGRNVQESTTMESEKPVTISAVVEVDVVNSQETSTNQNYTHLRPTVTAASSLEITHSSQENTTASYSTTSDSTSNVTSPLLVSLMMPVSESSNRTFSTYAENRTSYEDLYLTTEADISNDTLADME